MKYLFIMVLIAGGYYFTQIKETSNFETWNQVLDKVQAEGASNDDVKFGANLLAKFFCEDKYFQEEIGSTVESCNNTYLLAQKSCETLVFSNAPDLFSSKESAIEIAKEYTTCVGIL